MMSPPLPAITALYAALLCLLLLALALPISRLRMSGRVGIGDGGNPQLARAIRAHANAVEWVLPVLLLMLVAELNRASPLLLHASGIALLIGRVLHAIGLRSSAGRSHGRFAGAGITWATLVVLAAWNLWAFARLALR
jgi:uncharacterized membrane protein YecN with MAPEG domain